MLTRSACGVLVSCFSLSSFLTSPDLAGGKYHSALKTIIVLAGNLSELLARILAIFFQLIPAGKPMNSSVLYQLAHHVDTNRQDLAQDCAQ